MCVPMQVEEQRLWAGASFTDPEGMDMDFDEVQLGCGLHISISAPRPMHAYVCA